jgi:2,5-diamino-6-(ribosylamino)-4(3H)-pyrimidinone 5'-phosphate reductase
MSVDGKIALPSRQQTKLSDEEDMARVHRLRNSCDAIIVGIGTVLADDPKLTVKQKYVKEPRQPLRVVMDSHGRTPPNAQVIDSQAPTLIATTCDSTIEERNNVEIFRCGNEQVDIGCLLKELASRNIKKVLVEGGETLIWEFLRKQVVDVLMIYIAPMVIGGTAAPTVAGGSGASSPDEMVRMHLEKVERCGVGLLLTYLPLATDDLND